jgi:hypothetical protein
VIEAMSRNGRVLRLPEAVTAGKDNAAERGHVFAARMRWRGTGVDPDAGGHADLGRLWRRCGRSSP